MSTSTRKSTRIRFPTARLASSTSVEKKILGFVKREVKVEGFPHGPIKDESLDVQLSLNASSQRKRKRELSTVPGLEDLKLIGSPKKLKVGRNYAPPEKYAHLKYLTDYLAEDLDGACESDLQGFQ